jgi:methylenetetrahydrofolate dehydrogenase (NADP+)/methenyltetrahydrofolate cyclohydrolase
VDGILLQLPLPAGLPEKSLLERLAPTKDVDGLHPVNLGKLVTEDPSGFRPCTPAGILELLAHHGIEIEGRNAVVLGRSTLVGKPLALLLLQRNRNGNASVTVAHSRSRDVPDLVRRADLLVAAVGSPRFVRGEWIRPGATVVDVGIHRVDNGSGGTQIVGDVDFPTAVLVAGALTPVPGGVGRMTVAMLLRNTVLAWKRHGEAARVPSD